MQPKFKLCLNSGNLQGVFGDGKCRLLDAIEGKGSLRAASQSLGISYRKAWGDLKKAQAGLHTVLVEKRRGGRAGGQTVLTPEGKKWTDAYIGFRRDIEKAISKAYQKHFRELTS